MIEIKPINVKEFTCKQSKYETAPKLPIRSTVIGPSGSGKSVLLTNLILNVYKGCFERVFVFSPSIEVDQTWQAVKEYQRNTMHVDDKTEKLYFDHYDPADLENIIETQHKIILKMKQRKLTKLFSILIIVDDFADDPSFSRSSKLLHSLYTRGRHNSMSTIVATQKITAISPIIRVNATELYVYRLRNTKDLECFLEENSAVVGKKELFEIYKLATDEPYSFLYINLRASKVNEMYHIGFNKKIIIE